MRRVTHLNTRFPFRRSAIGRSLLLISAGLLLIPTAAVAGFGVVAELNRAIDLEIQPAPTGCHSGYTLQRWEIVENHRGVVATLPPETTFDPPWRQRIRVGYGGEHEFVLYRICQDDQGTDWSFQIASTTGTSGQYGGTFYFDTTIKPDTRGNRIKWNGMRAVDTASITIEPGAEVDMVGYISAEDGDVTISGATLRGENGYPVQIQGTGSLSIVNSHLEDVWVGASFGAALEIIDSTIYTEGESGAFVTAWQARQVTVSGSRITAATNVFWVEGTTGDVEISDNRFHGIGGDPGLATSFVTLRCSEGAGSVEMTSNLVESLGDRVYISGPCLVSENLFRNSEVWLEGDGALLRDNRIFGLGVFTGIHSTNVEILDNVIRADWTAVQIGHGSDGSQVTLEGNSLCADQGYGVANPTGETVDATGNYWGHPTGPAVPSNPDGEGSRVHGPVEVYPWLTSGPCGTVYIEWLELAQELPDTDPVAGKPAVLRVYLRNGWTSPVSGVSLEGEMDGLSFSIAGLRVPTDYSDDDIHLGRDSVNIVGLPPPVVGPGQINLRLHYRDPQFGDPVTEAANLSYSGLSQRALRLGVWAIDIGSGTLNNTLTEMLPFVWSLYPTPRVEHDLMEFGLAGEPSNRVSAYAVLQVEAMRHGFDSAVAITSVGWLGSFGLSAGRVSLVEAYRQPCQQGGANTFALAHEVLHAVANAVDEYIEGNEHWDDEAYPHGWLVERGWDVYRGEQGIIHSKVPSNPQHTCSSYQPGNPGHSCNFYNIMATECLPPKWINETTRYSLLSKLAAAPEPEAAGKASALAPEPVAALLIPITLWEDGSADLPGIWDITAELTPDDPFGLWSVESRTDAGAVLDRIAFEPRFREVDPANGLRSAAIPILLPANPAVAEIVLLQNESEVSSLLRTGGPPTVTVLSPNGGESLSGGFTAEWSAVDPDGDPLTYSLAFRCESADHWTPVVTGHTGTSWTVDTADLPGGTHCRAQVIADDGLWSDYDTSDGTFSIEAHPPVVQILSPVDGASVAAGHSVTLSGQVSDPDGDAPPLEELEWSSDLVGPLGTGSPLIVEGLIAGLHTVTLRATDRLGEVGEDSVTLTVELGEDVDEDDLPDWWEEKWGTEIGVDDGDADPDDDLLTNLEELAHGTDPFAPDSDSDGYGDGEEVAAGTDPLDARSNPGELFADDFESGDLSRWSNEVQ
jgi:hypothetical protein